MEDAAILRIVATVAGVIIIAIGGFVGSSCLDLPRDRWWATVLGAAISLVMIYIGYKTIRSGNFGAYYGS